MVSETVTGSCPISRSLHFTGIFSPVGDLGRGRDDEEGEGDDWGGVRTTTTMTTATVTTTTATTTTEEDEAPTST